MTTRETAEEIAKYAYSYIGNKGIDASGFSKWESKVKAGWNAKLIGFLYIHRNEIKPDFSKSFSQADLASLFTDIRGKTGKRKEAKISERITQGLLIDLFRYAVAFQVYHPKEE